MESSIAKEIAQMKESRKSRRFVSIPTGTGCGIYNFSRLEFFSAI